MNKDFKKRCKDQDEKRYKQVVKDLGIGTFERKKKKQILGLDKNFNDPMGVELAKKEKANTIEISKNTKNPVEKFLLNNPIKSLLGKRAYCVKSDNSRFYEGWIVDVLPSKHIMVKVNDKNMLMTFSSCISIGDA